MPSGYTCSTQTVKADLHITLKGDVPALPVLFFTHTDAVSGLFTTPNLILIMYPQTPTKNALIERKSWQHNSICLEEFDGLNLITVAYHVPEFD